jgi:hypothetical protein
VAKNDCQRFTVKILKFYFCNLFTNFWEIYTIYYESFDLAFLFNDAAVEVAAVEVGGLSLKVREVSETSTT